MEEAKGAPLNIGARMMMDSTIKSYFGWEDDMLGRSPGIGDIRVGKA